MLYYIVGAVILYYFYYFFVKPFKYWKSLGVAQYSLPETWYYAITGWIRVKHISEEIEATYNHFSNLRYYGTYSFGRPDLYIRDPDLIKRILVKDFDHFVDHISQVDISEQPMWGKNLFFLQGEKWRHMRNRLTPSFTSSKLKLMFGLVSESADQFVQHFENQNKNLMEVEMRDAFTRFTNDVIATTAFGITCDSMKNPDNEFYTMGKQVSNFDASFIDMLKFMFLMMVPKLAKLFNIQGLDDKPYEFFKNVIKENIKARKEQGVVRPDMIHQLLESNKSRSGDTEEMSDEDIAAQAFIFFLAGFDSVATLLTFMAYELALHSDVQARLHDEIDDLQNSGIGKLGYEDLSKLKYLEQVISETNRKWAGAFVTDRICVKPYTIEPVNGNETQINLNVGDAIQIPIIGLHRDPNYFPNPGKFDPSRFEDEKAIANSFTYLPFGTGPRGCIAIRFALMEIKSVFFKLLSNFEFTVIEKTQIPLKLSKTKFPLENDEGIWLGLKPRKLKNQ